MKNAVMGMFLAILLGCGGSSGRGGETSTQSPAVSAGVVLPTGVVESSHSFTSPDGWVLNLVRHHDPTSVLYQEPLLLLHGYMESARFFDLDPDHSVARHLAGQGFDVWSLDARGAGASQTPDIFDLFGWTFSFDDFIHKDLPAAIAKVQSETGASQVFLGGHSMGCMIIYAYLQTHDASPVKGVLSIAGPGILDPEGFLGILSTISQITGLNVTPLLIFDTVLPAVTTLRKFNGDDDWKWDLTAKLLDTPLAGTPWNVDNMDPNTIHKLMRYMVADIPTNIQRAASDWVPNGDFYTYGPSPYRPNWGSVSDFYIENGFVSYTDWSTITTPILFLVGNKDKLATPETVLQVANQIGSTDNTFLLCSKDEGFAADYGHMDIVLGESAPTEIYPILATWLKQRATPK